MSPVNRTHAVDARKAPKKGIFFFFLLKAYNTLLFAKKVEYQININKVCYFFSFIYLENLLGQALAWFVGGLKLLFYCKSLS